MMAKQCDQYINVCYTQESTTLVTGNIDHEIIGLTLQMAAKMFGTRQPKPTKLSEESKQLKEKLNAFATSSEFLAEFPSVKGVKCTGLPRVDSSLDAYSHNHKLCEPSTGMTTLTTLHDIADHMNLTIPLLHECYDLTRRPCKEVLVVCLSDLEGRRGVSCDHHFIPLSNYMVGFSFLMKTARAIMMENIESAAAVGVTIKVCAFDGQFHEIAQYDANGQPLTLLTLHKQVWQESTKLSKKDLVDYIQSHSTEAPVILQNTQGNVAVSYPNYKALHLPDKAKTILRSTKESELLIIDPDSAATSVHELEPSSLEMDAELGEVEPPEEEINIEGEEHEDFHTRLQEMLIDLRWHSSTKWDNMSMDDLKKKVTGSARQIETSLTIPELKIILRHSDNVQVRLSSKKSHLVNEVARIHGDGSTVTVQRKVKSLKAIVKSVVEQWPKLVLNIIHASNTFPIAYSKWQKTPHFFPNGVTVLVMEEDEPRHNIKFWYAQPELLNGQLLFCFDDPHHILCNNRSLCCQKGMPAMNIDREAWHQVARNEQTFRTGLNEELAVYMADRQRNSYAQTTFSEPVESAMVSLGFNSEAQWCNLIRNWYRAVDEGGVSLSERIEIFTKMREHLLKSFPFQVFPPPGLHINDMTVAQFEGILINIDRRLQLLQSCSYNQRAISSLDSETFFSAFQVKYIKTKRWHLYFDWDNTKPKREQSFMRMDVI